MTGTVDDYGRSLLPIRVARVLGEAPDDSQAWIDTAFTGQIKLLPEMIEGMDLERAGSVDALLAVGSVIEMALYKCWIEWFGKWERVDAITAGGRFPLLGVALMADCDLHINYPPANGASY
jgi:predicted aspartyl protease